MVEEFFLDGVPVEPGDRAKAPSDGGAGAAAGFQVAGAASMSARRAANSLALFSGRDHGFAWPAASPLSASDHTVQHQFATPDAPGFAALKRSVQAGCSGMTAGAHPFGPARCRPDRRRRTARAHRRTAVAGRRRRPTAPVPQPRNQPAYVALCRAERPCSAERVETTNSSARRCGAGRTLVGAVRAAASTAEAIRLSVQTEPSNTAAFALYRASGFPPVEDLHVLALDLPPSDK